MRKVVLGTFGLAILGVVVISALGGHSPHERVVATSPSDGRVGDAGYADGCALSRTKQDFMIAKDLCHRLQSAVGNVEHVFVGGPTVVVGLPDDLFAGFEKWKQEGTPYQKKRVRQLAIDVGGMFQIESQQQKVQVTIISSGAKRKLVSGGFMDDGKFYEFGDDNK